MNWIEIKDRYGDVFYINMANVLRFNVKNIPIDDIAAINRQYIYRIEFLSVAHDQDFLLYLEAKEYEKFVKSVQLICAREN